MGLWGHPLAESSYPFLCHVLANSEGKVPSTPLPLAIWGTQESCPQAQEIRVAGPACHRSPLAAHGRGTQGEWEQVHHSYGGESKRGAPASSLTCHISVNNATMRSCAQQTSFVQSPEFHSIPPHLPALISFPSHYFMLFLEPWRVGDLMYKNNVEMNTHRH